MHGQLRVEAEGDARFQVWLQDGSPRCHLFGSWARTPLPHADIGLAVARRHGQGLARRQETPCSLLASAAESTRRDTSTTADGRCPSPVRPSNCAVAWLGPFIAVLATAADPTARWRARA